MRRLYYHSMHTVDIKGFLCMTSSAYQYLLGVWTYQMEALYLWVAKLNGLYHCKVKPGIYSDAHKLMSFLASAFEANEDFAHLNESVHLLWYISPISYNWH